MSIGEAARPRVFCCADVAVSIREACKTSLCFAAEMLPCL